MNSVESDPTRAPRPEQLVEAWSILQAAGYLETAGLPYFRSLAELPAEVGTWLRRAGAAPSRPRVAWPDLHHRAFRRRHPELFDLFALFALGRRLPIDRLVPILGTTGIHQLTTAGLLRLVGAEVESSLRIYFWAGQPFMHDAPASSIAAASRAYTGRDSLRFAAYLQQELGARSYPRALDLCTGCGLQAQVLAGMSDTVVAVDRNPRALAFARANIAINGIEKIALVRADLTGAIAGRFDLIVANPPFVYLPRPLATGHDLASDGGLLGIGLSRRILARMADLLRPDGRALVLTSLPGSPDRPILERWIERRLLPRGLEVRLRFVEYLWRADQYDAYRARGMRTPALVVAEVRHSSHPRLLHTRPPLAERLILARQVGGAKLAHERRRVAAAGAALQPARWRRGLPLAVSCAWRTTRVPVPPVRLALEPTTHCPLDCLQCARAERITTPRHLEPAAFEQILAATRPRRLHLHGCGEPLAHPEIDRLCATAQQAGARVALVTSLPEAEMLPRAARALPHLERLIIGVDATTEATYTTIRRGGELASVLETLRALRHHRARSGQTRPAIHLSFLIQRHNWRELPAFVRLAYGAGADAAIFLSLDLTTIEERAPELVGTLEPEELRRTIMKARQLAARIGMRTNLDLLLETYPVLRHRYWGEPLAAAPRCLRPWLSTYVTVDGEVRPCSRYAYDASANMGRIDQQPFAAAIWNGAAYRQLRAELRGRRPSWRHCAGCSVPAEEGEPWANLRRRRRAP